MAQTNQEPKPGDLIEINRPLYQHWAVYVGGGYVVHLVTEGKDDGVPANSSFSPSVNTKKALVKKQLLSEVTEKNKWRINNKYDNKYDPKPVREIVEAALKRVGEKIDYNVVTMNCEHFATNLRYGLYLCEQVRRVAEVLGAGIGSIGAIGALAAVGATTIMKSLARQ